VSGTPGCVAVSRVATTICVCDACMYTRGFVLGVEKLASVYGRVSCEIHVPGEPCIGGTAILIIIEGQFQLFQRFSSSKLVLKTVASCFAALNYYENGSTISWHDACNGESHVQVEYTLSDWRGRPSV
jgi:hypothetical protein